MSEIVHPETSRGDPIEEQFEVAIDAAFNDAAYFSDSTTDVGDMVNTMQHYLTLLEAWRDGDPPECYGEGRFDV